MPEIERLVRKNETGAGWVVLAVEGGDPRRVCPTKKEAVSTATAELRGSSTGGRLRVYLGSGRLEVDRLVGSDVVAASERPPPAEVVAQVRREGEKVDSVLDAGSQALAFAGFIGVPGIAALISPEVQEAAGDGWWAVLIATFTWTAGCALAVVVWNRSGLAGWPLISATVGCFLVALGVAWILGSGVLDVESGLQTAGNPFAMVLVFVEVAVRTYGPLGALLGLGIGCWLGSRLAPLVDEGFLV